MGKAKGPRLEVLQMIERVAEGEDAEAVITGRKPRKEKKGDPDGLDERLERFLRGNKRKK